MIRSLPQHRHLQELDKLAQDKQSQWLFTQAKRLFFKQLPPPTPLEAPQRILVFGIEGAGLTTFLEALHLGPVQTTIPYIGLELETVRYRDIEFVSWPTDGCRKDYPRWQQFFTNVRGIIQIVDVAETVRFVEAMECIRLCEYWFGKVEAMSGVPLLVLGSKADLLTARRQQELDYDLSLRGLRGRRWASQLVNCLTGDGVAEGLRWLVSAILVEHDDDELTLGGVCHEKDIKVLEK